MNSNLFLIGFMGSGKSTVSDYMHRTYGMRVVEMDAVIADREGMSIPQIFETHGEEYFRNLETALLCELQTQSDTVISCGGGTPMRDCNVAEMRKSGRIVLLDAKPETIYERVKDNHDRPLLEQNKTVEYIRELMEKRRERYEAAADITIHTDEKSAADICAEIRRACSA